MAIKIFYDSTEPCFTRKLKLRDHEGDNETQVELAITTDNSGAPEIHIGPDCEEFFENKNTYKLHFADLLDIVANNYLDGYHYASKALYSYKHLASVLRHYANLMDVRAEEEYEKEKVKADEAYKKSKSGKI